MSTLRRLAPLSGIAGIICVLAGFVSASTPTPSWSDAEIEAWFGSHSLGRWMFAAYLIGAGALLLLVFAGVMRERMADAGISRTAISIAHAGALALAVTTLVGAGLFAAIPVAHILFDAPVPTPDVSRYLSGVAYGSVVVFNAFGAALLAATLSIVSLRTSPAHVRMIPKWLAIIGIPASLLMVANAAVPMFPMVLWYGATCIALCTKSRQFAPTAVAQPAYAA